MASIDSTVLAVALVLWVAVSGFLMGRPLRDLEERAWVDRFAIGVWLWLGGFFVGAGLIRDILS